MFNEHWSFFRICPLCIEQCPPSFRSLGPISKCAAPPPLQHGPLQQQQQGNGLKVIRQMKSPPHLAISTSSSIESKRGKHRLLFHTTVAAIQCILRSNEEGGHGAANVEGRHVGRQWRLMRDSRCGGEAALASHDHPTIRVASLVVILYLFSDL